MLLRPDGAGAAGLFGVGGGVAGGGGFLGLGGGGLRGGGGRHPWRGGGALGGTFGSRGALGGGGAIGGGPFGGRRMRLARERLVRGGAMALALERFGDGARTLGRWGAAGRSAVSALVVALGFLPGF